MPDDLQTLSAKLRAFSFEAETFKIVDDNKNKLADLQAEQWAQGKNQEGQYIELTDNPEYNYGYRPSTIYQKQKYGVGLGKVTSYITFYQTGTLYENLTPLINGETFSIESSVSYFKELIARSNEADGLDEEKRTVFGTEVYLPALKEVVKSKTGIEF